MLVLTFLFFSYAAEHSVLAHGGGSCWYVGMQVVYGSSRIRSTAYPSLRLTIRLCPVKVCASLSPQLVQL